MKSRITFVFLGILAATAACGDDGGDDTCVQVDASCTPLYTPTFDEVFSRTLRPKCGVAGSSCHAAEGAQAGLVFADPDDAYQALLQSRVIPGDPGCSLVVRRLESGDPGFVMPPGAPLAAGELCAIIQWIANGAER